MKHEIILMPETDGSGDVIEFCIEIGDSITAGDALLVLESDKASIEVPVPMGGVLEEWLVDSGQSVETGTPLARVRLSETDPVADTGDSEQAAVSEQAGGTEQASVSGTDTQVSEGGLSGSSVDDASVSGARRDDVLASDVSDRAVASETDTDAGRSQASGQRTYAGPATRKLARELGVVLNQVQGSGSRGRILKEDIKGFVKQKMTERQAPVTPAEARSGVSTVPAIPAQDFSQFGQVREDTLSGIARATSAHMTRCWLNIPHVTLFDEVNISELETYRKQITPELLNSDKKPSLLPFIVMTVARALRHFPQFNCSINADGDGLIFKDYVNIGIAVDTPAGLVVPVIRDADKKGIAQLSQDIRVLADKAKQRKLTQDDMKGGCFTVSSLGAMGGTGFTPIINAPEVAILGVARSEIKPVWDAEQSIFQPATKLPLCLSFDHRVINGADAGRFMAWIHQCLTEIRQLIL